MGGGVIAAGELLLEPARAVVAERALPPSRDEVAIVPARFGIEAGMVGAATLAREGLEGRDRPLVSGGRLIVCPTPIGNLEDITLRALASLRDADLVACEDTRRTGVLLERFGVSAKLISYHEHNEAQRARELVAKMRDGAVVALVSDAGMPLVSDPGFVLVRECVAAGLAVEVLPGPSALLAALVASALPAEHWRFAGFLPAQEPRPGGGALLHRDRGGVRVAAPGRRDAQTLATLDPERPVAVCRELTKLHEEVVRGKARRARRALRRGGAKGRSGAGDRGGADGCGGRAGSRGRRSAEVDRGWSQAACRGRGGGRVDRRGRQSPVFGGQRAPLRRRSPNGRKSGVHRSSIAPSPISAIRMRRSGSRPKLRTSFTPAETFFSARRQRPALPVWA